MPGEPMWNPNYSTQSLQMKRVRTDNTSEPYTQQHHHSVLSWVRIFLSTFTKPDEVDAIKTFVLKRRKLHREVK